MTTKSSEEMVAPRIEALELTVDGPWTEEKNSRAKSREHTIEHSIGVTDTLRKACRFAQAVGLGEKSSIL